MPLSEDTDLRILHGRASDVQEEMLKELLVEKIGKFSGSGIYQLCTELVALRQRKTGKPDHIENHHGKRVYTFLNSVFPREVEKRRR